MLRRCVFSFLSVVAVTSTTIYADEEVKRPRVFLDKNPRIVAYQLNRLSNEQLLLVERAADHEKYQPVFTAILTRAGMSRKDRDDALHGLTVLNRTDAVTELLAALGGMDADDAEERRTSRQLATMLLKQPQAKLSEKKSALEEATGGENEIVRSAGLAALVVAGEADAAWEQASENEQGKLDFLAAVSLVPQPQQRANLRDAVVSSLNKDESEEVQRAAIRAIATLPSKQQENFRQVAGYVTQDSFRVAAVKTLLKIPAKFRERESAETLVKFLVTFAEETPAAKRTTDNFIDAMQLTDQLMGLLPIADARDYRERLRAVTVRVVRINTVEEEMRYDVPYFAVEAGRPVQVVLHNEDLMPHNLVVTMPDKLQQVAEAGAALGPQPGKFDHPYVPKSDDVLFATGMVQAHQTGRLTFTAPKEPGEYPFVCTFPRHWMRMYGVMIVVDDLGAWQRNPTEPKDPIGNTRSFVANWKLEDLKSQIDTGMRGRSIDIGARIFTEATCAQCHKMNGQGGAVGPELTEVFKRYKNVRADVLREILDPSHKIDPKYAVRMVVTDEGRVLSGIVAAEDNKQISLIVNPEAKKPEVVSKDEIEEMVKSSKSMMPKALLDRFTKDEIFELLNYLEVRGSKK